MIPLNPIVSHRSICTVQIPEFLKYIPMKNIHLYWGKVENRTEGPPVYSLSSLASPPAKSGLCPIPFDPKRSLNYLKSARPPLPVRARTRGIRPARQGQKKPFRTGYTRLSLRRQCSANLLLEPKYSYHRELPHQEVCNR